MKDRIFLDTNIVIDILGEREAFYESAAKIATLADKGSIQVVISALTYSTVFYVLSKFEDNETVKEKMRKLMIIVQTAPVTEKIIEQSLISKFTDFEDAIQYYCAENQECNMIITRNVKDYKDTVIPVFTPEEYLHRKRTV